MSKQKNKKLPYNLQQEKLTQAIIYLRCSTDYQTVENGGLSLETQQDKCEKHCSLYDMKIKKICKDAGISGRKKSNRPGLQEALDSLEEGDALIVYSLSRLSRNTKEALELANIINEKGCYLISITEKIDTTDEVAGKFYFTMIAALAQLESDQISSRVKAGMDYKKSIGGKVGRPPYGYKYVDKNLVKDDTEQSNIKLIKELHLSGLSCCKIVEYLKDHDIKPRHTCKKGWHHYQVSCIIKNNQ